MVYYFMGCIESNKINIHKIINPKYSCLDLGWSNLSMWTLLELVSYNIEHDSENSIHVNLIRLASREASQLWPLTGSGEYVDWNGVFYQNNK